jgi:predicted PolB exonuclease-like 3'-5' exonuclease
MLRFLAKDALVFDTEFVPDAEAGRRLVTGEHWPVESQVIDAMWQAHNDYDADTNPRPFLKPILCKVVSIGYVHRRAYPNGKAKIRLGVNTHRSEATMLAEFLSVGKMKPQLVGYNSESCDLPLLAQRAMVHKLDVPAFFTRPNKSWERADYWGGKVSDWHVDLMHELGGFGRSAPSLSEACAALNILGGAKDVTGADVVDLYLEGDFDAIHRYCATDAVRQFLILLRLALLAGFVTREQHDTEADDVTQQLAAYTAPQLIHS